MGVKLSTNITSLLFLKKIQLLHNAVVIEGVLPIIIGYKDHLIFELETNGYLRNHDC